MTPEMAEAAPRGSAGPNLQRVRVVGTTQSPFVETKRVGGAWRGTQSWSWDLGRRPAKVTLQDAPGPRTPLPRGLDSPWEWARGRSGRPEGRGTLTAAWEPSWSQQLGELAQQRGQRHLARHGSAFPQPRLPWSRCPAERPLAERGAGFASCAAALSRDVNLRILVIAWYSSSPGLSLVSVKWGLGGNDQRGKGVVSLFTSLSRENFRHLPQGYSKDLLKSCYMSQKTENEELCWVTASTLNSVFQTLYIMHPMIYMYPLISFPNDRLIYLIILSL